MQLLTFLLNGVKFGIPVNDVESIETRMNVVNIPNSLPQVHGIMNLHGEVIAVYSLAEQFHYPEQEINNIIVASMNGTKIGLEVGNVDEIIDVPDEKVISMPVIMKAVENCFDEVASYAKELMHGKKKLMYKTGESRLFKNLPDTFAAARYHSLAALKDTLPAELKVTAESEDGEVMAVEHTKYPVFGVQFHPESVMTPDGRVMIENFMEVVRND